MIDQIKTRRPSTDCINCATRSFCPLGKLPVDTRMALQPLIRKIRFQRDETLIEEGVITHTVKIIQLGLVFESRVGREGRSRPLAVAGRGDVLGLPGFFDQPNVVTGTTVTSGRLCQIEAASLRQHVPHHPHILPLLYAEAARFINKIGSWSEGMRVRGSVNQLAYALILLSETQDNPVIELPTHTALAELLGSTRETVVRSLTTLANEGAICRLERRNCLILRHQLLARLRSENAAPPTPTPG